jgi:tetratricopeptide (TPR) repeat protein
MDHEELRSLSKKKLWTLFEENEGVDQGEVGVVLASKLAKSREEIEAIAVAERVVKLGESLANNYFLAEGYFWIGWSNYSLRRFDESHEAYKTCVSYYMQDGLEQAAATGIGNAIDGLLEMDKNQDAYEFSLEGLNLARQANATRQIGYLGRQFIRACRALNKTDEIVSVAPEIIEAWNQIDDPEEMVRVKEWYALALTDAGNFDEALESWQEIEIVARALELPRFQAYALLKRARIYIDLDDVQRGLQLAERALEFAVERKMLWYSALAHFYIADSKGLSFNDSLYHLDEAIALVRATSDADGWTYANMLRLKVNMTQYKSNLTSDFYGALSDLYAWCGDNPYRIEQKAFVEVRLFEQYLDDDMLAEAEEMYETVQQTLNSFEDKSDKQYLFIIFGSCELQLLRAQEKYQDVVDRGFVFLQEYAEHRTTNFQIPIAYETLGDALHALGDSRSLEMWTSALILFANMNFDLFAKELSNKLLEQVSVPGQLL